MIRPVHPPPLPRAVALLAVAVAAGAFLPAAAPAQDPAVGLAAEELLAAAIAYHDPDGVWGERRLRLVIRETRPDAPDRLSEIDIDPAAQRFTLVRTPDGRRVESRLEAAKCRFTVDGEEVAAAAEREALGLDCGRLERMRNYYAYLWGLPMKLRDPGTIVGDSVDSERFGGRPALALRVAYEPGVGGDTWIFYFHPENRRLIGYRFYHDEEAGDGEYIFLEGEVEGAGLRLPKSRAWYTHQGDEYLGTDVLESIE